MKDGLIAFAGIGIKMREILEIDFQVTVEEMASFTERLRKLQCGDSTKIFEAEGEFKGQPVIFRIRLKQ